MFQKKFCVYSQQMVQNGKLLTRRNDFSVLSEYFVMKGILSGLGLLKNDTQPTATSGLGDTDGSSSKEGNTLQERIGKILLGILEMNDNALNTTDDTSFISTLITAIGHILPPTTTTSTTASNTTTSSNTTTASASNTSNNNNVLISQALVQMRNLLFLETLIPSVRNQIGISILKVLRDWIRKGVLDSTTKGEGTGTGSKGESTSGSGSGSGNGSAVSGIFWVMIGGRNGLDIRKESVNGLLDRGLYIDVFMYAMSYITAAGTTTNTTADTSAEGMTTGNTGIGESAGNEDNDTNTRSRKRRKFKKGFVRMDCEWSIRVYILDRVFKDVLYILESGRMPPFRLSDTAVGEEERAVGVSSGVGSGGSGVGARGGESKSTSKLVGAAVEEDLGGSTTTATTTAGTTNATTTTTTDTTTNNTSISPTEIINFFSSPKTKHFIIKAIEHDWTPFRIKLLLCSFYESFYSMFKEMDEKKERQRFLELEILKERESAGGLGGGVGAGVGAGGGGGGVGVGGGIKLKIKLPVLQGQQEVGSASGVSGETKVLPKLKLRVSGPLLGSSTGTVDGGTAAKGSSTAVEAVVGSTAVESSGSTAVMSSDSTVVKKSRIIKLRIPRRIIRLIKPTSDDAAEGTTAELTSSMDVDNDTSTNVMTTDNDIIMTDNIATTNDTATTDNNENTDIK